MAGQTVTKTIIKMITIAKSLFKKTQPSYI